MLNYFIHSYNQLFSFFDQARLIIFESIYLRIVRLSIYKTKIKYNNSVDIILPTYNRAEMLKTRSIPSVLNQTYKNFRLIIIGDCCTDNTEKIVKSFNDDRIIYKNLKKRTKRYPPTVENHWFVGPVVAINEGLKLIKSDWIARIDDDDIWTNDHLDKLIKKASKYNSEFVSSSYIAINNGQEVIKNFVNEKPPIGGVQTWLYRSYLKFYKSNINCWRKNWNKVNDLDLQNRFFKSGVKIRYLEDVTCLIKPRPNEKLVGIKAYIANETEYLKNYEFK